MIKNGSMIAAAFFASLLAAAGAQAQTVTYDSNARTDFTAAHPAVSAGRTLAGGWMDLQGDIYFAAGDSLHATTSDANGYLSDLALRPAAENPAPNVEGTMYVPNGIPNASTANGLVLRFQPDKTFYLFQLSPDMLFVYKISGGRAAARLGSVPVRPNAAHPYSLTASAVNTTSNGGSGVTLTVSATDARTGKPIGSFRVLDVYSPILETGRAGIDSWVGNNEPGTATASYARILFSQLPDTPITVSNAAPKIGFIGDSITAGYNQVGSTITPGTNDAAALTIKALTETKAATRADAGIAWNAYDQGISGSSTADWLPGNADSLETRAKTTFSAAFGRPDPKTNPVWVLLMLGTNDVRSDHRFTAKQHRQNLQAITADLVAGGYNVVLNHAPSFVTPTRFNGVSWDAASLRLLQSYLPGEQAVAASYAHSAPGRVFLGDTSAFRAFAARPRLFQEYRVYGGLHPNGSGGTETLAAFWAGAFNRCWAHRPR